MGLLVDGVWQDEGTTRTKPGGRFQREATRFHNWITPDGSAGPTGEGGFPAEPGRYHLYVSLACPWAHRTLIFRKLKKLEDADLGLDRRPVHAARRAGPSASDGATGDHLHGIDALRDIYLEANPHYSGRVTVPVLWDKKQRHDRQQRIRPKSSACSIRRSTPDRRARRLLSAERCAARSIASTRASTTHQ